jgi:hypothetical protein
MKYGLKTLNRGYVALLSVMLIAAISTAVAFSLLLLSASNAATTYTLIQAAQARAIANACAEAALGMIRYSVGNSAYVSTIGPYTIGSGNGSGSCTYTITSTGTAEGRKIQASGTVGTLVKKVQVTITNVAPSFTVSSWQEVTDFN